MQFSFTRNNHFPYLPVPAFTSTLPDHTAVTIDNARAPIHPPIVNVIAHNRYPILLPCLAQFIQIVHPKHCNRESSRSPSSLDSHPVSSKRSPCRSDEYYIGINALTPQRDAGRNIELNRDAGRNTELTLEVAMNVDMGWKRVYKASSGRSNLDSFIFFLHSLEYFGQLVFGLGPLSYYFFGSCFFCLGSWELG